MSTVKIAAIFDVDGTLLTGASLERIFINFLIRRGELKSSDIGRFISGAFEGIPWVANKNYLRGKDQQKLAMLARVCLDEEISPRLLPAALTRLRWHQASGHQVALLSGTLDLLLAPLADRLGVRAVSATNLETVAQQVTGRIVGGHPFGEGKVDRLRELGRRFAFDPKSSFAYGNHYTDRHFLEKVGHPVAANPDRQLRQLAHMRGWLIEDFTTPIKPRFNLEMARGVSA
ncbi:MAG: HAD-IB family hydrolase [Acidobacteriota bacterium]